MEQGKDFQANNTGAAAAGVQNVVSNLQNLVQAVNALTAALSTQFGADNIYAVAKLPTTGLARAFVSDSTVAASTHFGATVVGGGTNTVPVYFDNATWKIG
jgi:hypothetical protein